MFEESVEELREVQEVWEHMEGAETEAKESDRNQIINSFVMLRSLDFISHQGATEGF